MTILKLSTVGGGNGWRGSLAARALTAWTMYRGGDWVGLCEVWVVVGATIVTTLHIIRINPKQFCDSHTWRLVSWKVLREFNARFRGRKVKWVRRKIAHAKNRIKETNRTNITATDFVWGQLKIFKKQNKKNWMKSNTNIKSQEVRKNPYSSKSDKNEKPPKPECCLHFFQKTTSSKSGYQCMICQNMLLYTLNTIKASSKSRKQKYSSSDFAI